MPSSAESSTSCGKDSELDEKRGKPHFLADRETLTRFGHGRLGGHAGDTCIRGAGFEPDGKPVDCRRISARKHFDVAIGQVDRVTGETQGLGHQARVIAEKNALDPPAYYKTSRLAHYLSPVVVPDCRIH